MKLLLTSAGLVNQPIINALSDLVQKPFKELKLAFIPTAANVEPGGKEWLIDDLQNCKKLNFKQVDIVDISAVSKAIWQPRLEQADILFFGGGNTHYLMDWVEKSGLKELLADWLKTKIYLGLSAGSEIAPEMKTPVYALDDNSAVKVDGDQVEVVSTGRWQKFN